MNLKEFAARLGLSQTTVSRALSGYPEVKKATRERVEKAAQEFGYRPNTHALGLATGRVGSVGLIFKGDDFGPLASEFISGLGARLREDDVDILISTVDSLEAELDIYRRLAASKRVDAIILHTPVTDDPRIHLLLQLGLPFVLHGRSETCGDYGYLDIDNFGAFHQATSHLADLGHRRIALVNGDLVSNFAQKREQGYCTALKERGIAIDPAFFGNGDFTDEMGFRLMQGFLRLGERPTAVLAGSMMSALGVMRAIRIAGLTVGRDISLIAHDDVFSYISPDNLVPTLSTTRSSIRAAGASVGDMVLKLLQGVPARELREVWPVELVIRRSSSPPV
ncbi:LacI family DNA-binding transcriptional regulator [Pararhizobium sp.]|uniref:LacI family DNA-binding transcriptional regulator n=1 Tax=Pararhizobium sp. TaxID=1977563 RepID=UPI002719641F|nr:substrate-binding domain-containing protein [Pararhizobium sp.]MDO9414954.1 substrate-binding domain-containing protein [Pararhizobium sp.]